MNHYSKYGLLIVVFQMIISCEKNKVNLNEQKASKKIESVNTSSMLVLDRNLVNEEFIELNLIKGMPKDKVEKIIGLAYKYSDFMGTIRADYQLSDPDSKGLHMVGFTVVYKDEKLYSVDEEWLGIHSNHNSR